MGTYRPFRLQRATLSLGGQHATARHQRPARSDRGLLPPSLHSSAALFGSILRSDFRPGSDVDVLVEFPPGKTPGSAFFQMQDELSDLLGRQVDLHTPGSLSRHFREQVEAEALVQYDAGGDPEEALRLGWAHGARLTTFPRDVSMVKLPEVEALAKGGSARVQR